MAKKPTVNQAIGVFLGMGFDDPEKPYRTQREMREEAHRVVGYNQAQEQLRHLLAQCTGKGPELAEAERHPNALTPMDGPGNMKLWTAPEFPVKKR